MATSGWIYSVKSVKECSGIKWAKVSWCHMTKKKGRGGRWAITRKRKRSGKSGKSNKKNKRFARFKEVRNKKNKPLCTWVKHDDLPIGLLQYKI